jgi:hypothetical protein
MAKRFFAHLLVASVLVASGVGSPKAADETDCTGSPPQAVMTLPKPLDKWGQIACTQFGHVLASRKGWLWVLPRERSPVMLPSQMVDRMPAPLGNKSYFTSIEVARVNGQEFEEVYRTFHDGFDAQETLPDGYRVDLTSVSGKKMRLYFFDYDTYAWGMECLGDVCDRNSRFMILDKDHMPQPRGPSI